MTKSIMFQGTGSNVGKSIICAAFCRILKDDGYKVAPFKAQNMALNSAVTGENTEIGRAQAFQAECAGISPSAYMNPILLKPTGNQTSQVIILGESHGLMSAKEYHKYKKKAWNAVKQAYQYLADEYDVIVIEGAGSPAEINIKAQDIVNMKVAKYTKAPVILIGDINLGGVFAWLIGTLKLLTTEEKRIVKGIVINKFRGDKSLLDSGLQFLETKTKKKVLGVLPYFNNLVLDDEDSLALEGKSKCNTNGKINIEVLRLPRISNFTDFDPFKHDPQVNLSFVESLSGKADIIFVPGSKNSIEDMAFIEKTNLKKQILTHFKKKKPIWGVCGGLQILGKTIEDPHLVESKMKNISGLGLLDVKTIYSKKKITKNTKGNLFLDGKTMAVEGYEIHYGESRFGKKSTPFVFGSRKNDVIGIYQNNVYGTYLHGIFCHDELRRSLLNSILQNKKITASQKFRYKIEKEKSIRHLAELVRKNLDVKYIYKLMGL